MNKRIRKKRMKRVIESILRGIEQAKRGEFTLMEFDEHGDLVPVSTP